MVVRNWIAVTVTPATGVSESIDMANAAIVAVATPALIDVPIFWIQVEIDGEWYTLAHATGEAFDIRLMALRIVPIVQSYQLPFIRARLSMPPITHDYLFHVCVETNA